MKRQPIPIRTVALIQSCSLSISCITRAEFRAWVLKWNDRREEEPRTAEGLATTIRSVQVTRAHDRH